MERRDVALGLFVLGALCAGCDPAGPEPEEDASTSTDALVRCASDEACDDGVYCNGAERCDPGDPASSPIGCVVAGSTPCPGATCDEAARRCVVTCDGPTDADGDGHDSLACGGDDCDDLDADRYPGHAEDCDDHDEDCDPTTLGAADTDGDGRISGACCNPDDDGTVCGADCDDDDASIGPGEPDGPIAGCNTIDDDCDGAIDETCSCTDGEEIDCEPLPDVGDCRTGRHLCVGARWASCVGRVEPADERCGIPDHDEDCDGLVDEGVGRLWYLDADGDGDGDPESSVAACVAPPNHVGRGVDCDDGDMLRSTVRPESCDRIDNDCDLTIDEGVTNRYWPDLDGDGYGRGARVDACARPVGYADRAGDCNDTASGVHPGLPEACNGIDDNCAGGVDEGCGCTDGTSRACGPGPGVAGVGVCTAGLQTCVSGTWSGCAGATYPAGDDASCNARDDDCDGATDEDVLRSYHRDRDGDGFGDPLDSIDACSLPAGYVDDDGDCDDRPALGAGVHPGVAEACDGIDQDCDTRIDEGRADPIECRAEHPMSTGVAVWRCTRSGPAGCEIGVCSEGREDCSGGATDGCEIDVATDPLHCGSCASACVPGAACDAGACESVTQLTAGGRSTCLLWSGGGVSCFGSGEQYLLRPTAITASAVPVAIDLPVAATRVAVASRSINVGHILAGGEDGWIYGWGRNGDSQIPTSTLDPTSTPTRIYAFRADVLAAGGRFGCEIHGSTPARLWCWGANDQGQCAHPVARDPFLVSTASPAADAVSLPGEPRALCAGEVHACAVVRVSGADTVYCWGDGSRERLGPGATGVSPTPVEVPGLTAPVALACGGDHTCALEAGGSIRCWGRNAAGQLGRDPATTPSSSTPVRVPGSRVFVALTAGADFTCGVDDAGRLFCWGDNASGQLGQGDLISRSSPTRVGTFANVEQVAAGTLHACLLRANGDVYCWGANRHRQAGQPSGSIVLEPALVAGF